MNKLIIPIIVILILAAGIGIYFVLQKMSGQKPTITEFSVSPKNPVIGETATLKISAKDNKGIKGFEISIDGKKKQISCNNQKVCTKQITQIIPETKFKTVTLKLIVVNIKNQQTTGQKQIIIIHKIDNPVCGNNLCETGETPENCPSDCEEPEPVTVCGNNICEVGEESSCSEDCEIEPPIIKTTSFIGADADRRTTVYKYLQPLAENQIYFIGAEKIYWNDLEPTEVSGYGSLYDEQVKNIESVGGIIAPTIWSVSTWATEVPSDNKPSSPPKEVYKERYSDFVKAFMERYDNDGIDDMPGLKYTHNYLQIEDEAMNLGDAWVPSSACDIYKKQKNENGYYQCAAKEYGEMLKLAYQAAHEANPNAKIISFSFNPGDYFDNNPSGNLPTNNTKIVFLNEVFTNYNQYFDVIGVQCNYDYTGLPAWINYIQTQWGHLNKPIQCADAGAMPMLIRHQFQPGDKYLNKYPFMTDEEILTVLDNFNNLKHDEIKTWWEGEKAKISVKKAVVAADVDVNNIFFQFIMSEWKSNFFNPWDFSGLLSAGPDYGQPEPIGTARTVVYALGQLNEKVDDFKTIENLNPIPAGEDPYNWVWKYKITNNTYITWTEKTEGATIDLSSYISTSNVKITPIITELDNSYNPIYPPSEVVPANAIPIYGTPIFVEIKN